MGLSADLTGNSRREAFMRAGLAAGFDAATLTIMFGTPVGVSEPAARSRLGPLTSDEWRAVKPCIPANILAAPGGSPRVLIDAVLHRVRFGFAGWRRLPADFGNADMLRQRWGRWLSSGALSDLMAALPDLDLSEARRQEFEAVGRMIAKAEARAGGR